MLAFSSGARIVYTQCAALLRIYMFVRPALVCASDLTKGVNHSVVYQIFEKYYDDVQ